jgi:peroxiredoxin
VLLMRAVRRLGSLLTALALAQGCNEAPASQPAVESAESKPPASIKPAAPQQKAVQPAPQDMLGTLAKGFGLSPGTVIPDVAAADERGQTRRLRELARDKALVLVFYRGGWCPFCNYQIHELTENAAAFAQRGAHLAAISVDKIDEASRTAATYTIPFPLLSDPELVVHRAFNVVHQADDTEVARLKGFGIDIERSSGKSHHAFAVPSIFIIGTDGAVRWAHADPDYKVRPSAAQLLSVLDSLGALR